MPCVSAAKAVVASKDASGPVCQRPTTRTATTACERCPSHSHKVSGSMRSGYGVVVRGTLLARDFYTLGRK
jgi:hypothetical protein